MTPVPEKLLDTESLARFEEVCRLSDEHARAEMGAASMLEPRMSTLITRLTEAVLTVLKVKGPALDWAYLRTWAREPGVEDDLELLMREAGI
jgi:predicted nucleotidyltransferase